HRQDRMKHADEDGGEPLAGGQWVDPGGFVGSNGVAIRVFGGGLRVRRGAKVVEVADGGCLGWLVILFFVLIVAVVGGGDQINEILGHFHGGAVYVELM